MNQRERALERGNVIRFKQAELRLRLRDTPMQQGRKEVAAIFRAPTDWQRRIKAVYLLTSISRFGPARTGRMIRLCGLGPGRIERRIGELSERECRLIADHLEDPNRPPESATEFTNGDLDLIRKTCLKASYQSDDPNLRGHLWVIAQKCEAGS